MSIVTLLVVLFVLCGSSTPLLGQSPWKYEVFISPIGARLNDGYVRELAEGKFELNTYNSWHWELGGKVSYCLAPNFDLGVGISFRNLQYDLSYVLTYPDNEERIVSTVDRSSKLLMLGPTIHARYTLNKFALLLGLEFTTPVSVNLNYPEYSDDVYVFYPGQPNQDHYQVREASGFHQRFLQQYFCADLRLSYDVKPRFSIYVDLKFRPHIGGLFADLYHLGVFRYTFDDNGVEEYTRYNTTTLKNSMFNLYVGLAYRFGE